MNRPRSDKPKRVLANPYPNKITKGPPRSLITTSFTESQNPYS